MYKTSSCLLLAGGKYSCVPAHTRSFNLRHMRATMQLPVFLASALLPLGLAATPGAKTETLESRAIVRPQYCAIVGGSSTVNCRTGPGTRYSVRTTLHKGTVHPFWCVVSAECVTINGSRNCGWDYIRDYDCFVNGHYTDDNCTLARLGKCGTDDDDYVPFPP